MKPTGFCGVSVFPTGTVVQNAVPPNAIRRDAQVNAAVFGRILIEV